jgi:hypothetical protein
LPLIATPRHAWQMWPMSSTTSFASLTGTSSSRHTKSAISLLVSTIRGSETLPSTRAPSSCRPLPSWFSHGCWRNVVDLPTGSFMSRSPCLTTLGLRRGSGRALATHVSSITWRTLHSGRTTLVCSPSMLGWRTLISYHGPRPSLSSWSGLAALELATVHRRSQHRYLHHHRVRRLPCTSTSITTTIVMNRTTN